MSAIQCGDIAVVDRSNLVISLVIAVGIVGSYVPQHLRIVRRGSSDGLSPFFLLLGVTSCTNSLINVAVLQWDVLRCCARLSAGVCAANSLGVVQLLLQWAMFSTTLVLFLVYFPRPCYFPGSAAGTRVPVARPVPRHTSRSWNLSVGVSLVAVAHLATFIAVSLSFLRRSATRTRAVTWANWLGGSAMVLSGLQYVPQIWTTFRRRTVGSLSVATLALQAPGSFVFAYSIAQRPGVRWSSWLLFVVTGTLQVVLVSLCLYLTMAERYHWGERRQIRREQAQRAYDVEEDERVGLLEEQTGDESEDEREVVRRTYEDGAE
ncbi:Putative uncharacterized protein [Taphrina deformans PYCC 5710]|uniref:PQ loop repeat protein n=1 Tax=Taphrina deformans (strain PYCC 5710 / ATCC 11124 / CBS 356.35 / IMI 108563 / JCM 9778 / NBRC 8474) TaxID=1097556 RepID=R4XCQ7_TAPDE|nr:Putative uncharacterized protein [Taphrina deformans PYCC 5710]|eukprot:CCG83624.1 Putative uncharacterized protein [Taphrina deformans PYCC 5710]